MSAKTTIQRACMRVHAYTHIELHTYTHIYFSCFSDITYVFVCQIKLNQGLLPQKCYKLRTMQKEEKIISTAAATIRANQENVFTSRQEERL